MRNRIARAMGFSMAAHVLLDALKRGATNVGTPEDSKKIRDVFMGSILALKEAAQDELKPRKRKRKGKK